MIKTIRPILSVVAAAVIVSCSSPGEKTVEYPLVDLSNTVLLSIGKVEMTDSSTVVLFETPPLQGGWLQISSDSYLMADGKKYRMTGTDGIKPDERLWLTYPENKTFSLVFEPLPVRTRSFDFIESDCDDCFKLYGIDLTGKTEYSPAKGVPAALRKMPDFNRPLPDPDFTVGETTVRVHLLNYRPEMGKKIDLLVNSMFGEVPSYSADIDPETGIAEFRFLQCGPASATVLYGYCGGEVWLAPGDDADIYFDMRITGWISRMDALSRAGDKGQYDEERPCFTYATGKYSDLTALCENRDRVMRYSMNPFSAEFADYDMTADEYTAHVISEYRAAADSIESDDAPAMLKELQMVNLKEEIVAAMAQADYLRLQNFMYLNDRWDLMKAKPDWIESLRPEHYARVCSLFDINDPKLLMGTEAYSFINAVTDPDIDWPSIAGLDSGLVPDLRKVSGLAGKVRNAALTEEDFSMLKSMDNACYHEAFSRMQAEAEKSLAETEGLAEVAPVPEVDNERLFDAIIAPYKGKIVLVDFWNTWCAPCRGAIEAVEPLKNTVLKSDDIVWLYIANESSPLAKYREMIPGIKGIHYRLPKDKWDYLRDKFGIDGIPSYVLVDRSGKYELRNDFRDHYRLKSELTGLLRASDAL